MISQTYRSWAYQIYDHWNPRPSSHQCHQLAYISIAREETAERRYIYWARCYKTAARRKSDATDKTFSPPHLFKLLIYLLQAFNSYCLYNKRANKAGLDDRQAEVIYIQHLPYTTRWYRIGDQKSNPKID